MIDPNHIRQALEAKRKELLSGNSDREEILIQSAADEFDRLQQQLNREVAIRNLDREAKLLKSIQEALSRIGEDGFGLCLRCDKEIPERRLQAIPWAAYCVPCQEEMDRQRSTGEVEHGSDRGELAA